MVDTSGPAVDVAKPQAEDLRMYSVTTILGALDKPALLYWAAEETAKTAVSVAKSLAIRVEEDGEDATTKWLRDARFRRPKGLRSATELGTAVHDALEQLALTGNFPDVDDEVRPFIEQADKWMQKFQPTYEAAEMTVYSPQYGYAGTLDAVAVIDGVRFLLDYKGLDVTTPIPTPTGWTTMGALRKGDQVFGSDGRPCTVTMKSRIHTKPCVRILFDNGTSIVCDNEHRWYTEFGKTPNLAPGVRTAEEIAANLKIYGQSSHRIPNAKPLDLPPADLPVDPYVFGLWLGDGSVHCGSITNADDNIWRLIRESGYQLGASQRITRTVLGLRKQLRLAGYLNFKSVPNVYLRGSYEQRLALLQGLMDSDGSWNPQRHRAVFSNTDKALALAVRELVLSLGGRATLLPITAHGFGVVVQAYHVTFTPVGWMPFRTPTKIAKVNSNDPSVAQRWLIRDIQPTVTVPTQCITVDSPDNTYLCGEQMVPTHNSSRKSVDGRGQPTTPYPEQVGLQLAAYRYAEYAATWRPRRYEYMRRRYYLLGMDEREMGVPVPEVDACLVLHLTPDHCEAFPIKADEEAFDAFLYTLECYRWVNNTSKHIMGPPLAKE